MNTPLILREKCSNNQIAFHKKDRALHLPQLNVLSHSTVQVQLKI